MNRKIVTLYIDVTSIRLLVTRGKRVKKWAELCLEPGLIEGATVINESEVAAKIKQLLKDQKVRARKVIVGLSGLHCITRPIILPQLPKAMLDEAVTREVKRLLPLPLDQVYTMWQTIPAPEGKTQVFLAAIRRRNADTLLKALHRVELAPRIMDLKPLALARLVKEATAVIVDVQSTEFDIVIMVDGIPQPIRTVTFPHEALSWQDKFSLIRTELDRTIQFYNSNNQEKPLASSTPIFVSGELACKSELSLSLSRELGYPVLPLSSPLECSEQLGLSRYMVNIGLALKAPSLEKQAGPSVVSLNLLPIPYRPKPISWGRVVAVPATVIIIGLLIPMVMLIQSVSANISALRPRLDATNQLLIKKQLQGQEMRGNITELNDRIAELEASNNAFTTVPSSIDREHSVVNGDLKITSSALPDTISVTNISHTGNMLTISGVSPTEAEVLSYAWNLYNSGRFTMTIIAVMKKTGDEGMDFTLTLRVGG